MTFHNIIANWKFLSSPLTYWIAWSGFPPEGELSSILQTFALSLANARCYQPSSLAFSISLDVFSLSVQKGFFLFQITWSCDWVHRGGQCCKLVVLDHCNPSSGCSVCLSSKKGSCCVHWRNNRCCICKSSHSNQPSNSMYPISSVDIFTSLSLMEVKLFWEWPCARTALVSAQWNWKLTRVRAIYIDIVDHLDIQHWAELIPSETD